MKLRSFPRLNSSVLLLLSLIAIGAYLRLKGLTFQSLWMDELHTMVEANPAIPIRQVLGYLTLTDQHPPLYFLFIHFWFKLVGYNDFSARLPSAIAGILTIPSAYFIGRELYNRSVGQIAAVFTTFNFYNISFSQEARGYIFAFLFSCFSFAYLIRTVRNPSWRLALLYALFTLLLIYTHYFGFMILASQFVILSILFLSEPKFRSAMPYFGAALLLIFIFYLPWIGSMLELAGKTTKFWLKKPTADFFVYYFQEYFGKDPMVIYAYSFLLIVFLAGGIFAQRKGDSTSDGVHDNYVFSFVVLTTWIVVSFLLPFVKSLVSVPLLSSRYTMVTLPAFVLAAAIGVELLFHRVIKIYIVVLIALLSVIDLFTIGKYYEKLTKTQWREMTSFVVANNPKNFPLISDREWHLSYYFSSLHASPHYVHENSINKLHSVWVITAHVGNPVSNATREIFKRDFKVRKSFMGLDCAAVLFVRQNISLTLTGGGTTRDGYRVLYDNGTIRTEPVELIPGSYNVIISGYGTKVENEFPKLAISLNGKVLNYFYLSDLKDYAFPIQIAEKKQVWLSMEFQNDAKKGNEDRNVFIRYIGINPITLLRRKGG